LVIGSASTLKFAFNSILSSVYEPLYPGVQVAPPYYMGSGAVAQVEVNTTQFSLEASADTSTLPSVLFPAHVADYEIAFGLTQMTIIVNLQSNAGKQVYTLWQQSQGYQPKSVQWNQTWAQILTTVALNSSTVVGVSNPFTDPSGYQAGCMIRLAGQTFFGNVTKLYNAIYNNPSKFVMRNTETDLVTLMQSQSGNLDFITSAYLSNSIPQTANSSQIAYITLPETINLGTIADVNYYHNGNFQYTEQSVTKSFTCNPVMYSLTIPIPSGNKEAAQLFVGTLLSPAGTAILAKNGISAIEPALVFGNYTSVPDMLKPFAAPVNSTYSSLFPSS
jgi:molybdate/tungstate transport system substrate-binding protein